MNGEEAVATRTTARGMADVMSDRELRECAYLHSLEFLLSWPKGHWPWAQSWDARQQWLREFAGLTTRRTVAARQRKKFRLLPGGAK